MCEEESEIVVTDRGRGYIFVAGHFFEVQVEYMRCLVMTGANCTCRYLYFLSSMTDGGWRLAARGASVAPRIGYRPT